MLFAWGARCGAGSLLSTRFLVARSMRVSRMDVRVAPRGDVLGMEDDGVNFHRLF